MRSRDVVKSVGLLTVLLTVGLLAAGCGGSGEPGAGVAPPSTPAVGTEPLGCSFYELDFTSGEVELLAADDPRIPEQYRQLQQISPQAIVTGAGYSDRALLLTRSKLLSTTGTPGRYVWHMTIANQSDETFGALPDGTVSGIEILFKTIIFKDAGNNPVNGGGTYGWTALNPVDGLPVYNTGEKLGPTETLDYDSVQFGLPSGATKASVGVLLRADTAYVHIPAVGESYVTTIAGTSTQENQTGSLGAALFSHPEQMFVDDNGDIYVAVRGNDNVVKIANGQVSVLAGADALNGAHGCQLYGRFGSSDYLVVTEENDHQVSLVNMNTGTVYRIAGSSTGVSGDVDGDGDTARFNSPTGIDVLGDTIYVADYFNGKIRKIRYEGYGSRTSPSSYYVTTLASSLNRPAGVCVDGQGNVFCTDYTDDKVYVIPRGTTTASVIVGSAGAGYLDGTGDVAKLNTPWGIDDDGAGNVYIMDYNNQRIRLMYMTGTDMTNASHWTVATIAGTGTPAIKDGVGSQAQLRYPAHVRVGPSGTLFFSGQHYLGRIDRIAPTVPY